MRTRLLAALAILVAAGIAYACEVACPLDSSCMLWTGQTRVEWGHLLYEYRCPAGHVTWVVK